MDISIDSSAVLWSAPADPDRPLLVLLHGFGSNEADLFGLVPYLPEAPVIASVRAPLREGPGFAWYPIDRSPGATPPVDRVDAAVRALLEWIDSLPPVRSISLLGFSQGAAMALQLTRYRPNQFVLSVQLSGFKIPAPQPGDADLGLRRPPVFWGRGTRDGVISTERVEELAAWLPEHSTLEARVYDTDHSIAQQELADISEFISSRL